MSNSQFRSLRWRLLLSYLAVMATILSIASGLVYHFFSRSLYSQLVDDLRTLAQVAIPNLVNLNVANLQSLSEPIPWRRIRSRGQSLEWFGSTGQLLYSEGAILPTLPLNQFSQKLQQQGDIITYTQPVYIGSSGDSDRKLFGYVRTSQSVESLEPVLNKLRWGMGIGGGVALLLSGLGGMWLTQQALIPIEKSFRQHKQFTADASHELRSPLAVIKTSIEVIQSHPERIHPLDSKKLDAIASATKQMTRLVEDLLLLVRTDSVLAQQDQVATPLDALLEDLIVQVDARAQTQQISLKSKLLPDRYVWGDKIQLLRLFTNLVDNALQYTPPGGEVIISMGILGGWNIVRVEDTGIGIAPNHLSLIFNRFWRADQARSNREGGMGLGLSICQAIARQHGGLITVRSQPGQGSCFQVQLPYTELS